MIHDPQEPVAPERFVADVLHNRFNRVIVERLADLRLPDVWLVAGCLFQTVWNLRSGQPAEAGIRDYDIFYFDGDDLSEQAEAAVGRRAAALFADLGVPIEIKNQARVHLWYEGYFRQPYSALRSACEGIDRFLVGCTAVGIQPLAAEPCSSHIVYAPYGLHDLYRGVLTRNPQIAHGPLFERKCLDYQARWSWLTIEPADPAHP